MNVAKQQGPSDCGLYAIAFARSLLAGKDPCKVTYNQSAMRAHLLQCLTDGELTEFPDQGVRVCRHQVALEHTVQLFCICKKLYSRKDPMIECKNCGEWFHPACIKMKMSIFAKFSKERQSSFCVC